MTRLQKAFLSGRGGAALHAAATLLTTLGVILTAAIVLALLGAPPAAVAAASVPLGVMAGIIMDVVLLRLHLILARAHDPAPATTRRDREPPE
jgi:hypothetical protein